MNITEALSDPLVLLVLVWCFACVFGAFRCAVRK